MPCARSRRSRAASSGSCTAIMPPSPVVITLRGCSEKHASGPSEPICAPLYSAPIAQAASSTIATRGAGRARGTGPCRPAGRLVDGHDRLRRGGDRALGGGRVEVVGARVDVGEDRLGAAVPDGVGGRDERQRRHDHLVARAHARDVQRERQRGRAAGRGHRLRGAHTRRERLLELRARAAPARPSPTRSPRPRPAPSAPLRCGRVIGISLTARPPARERRRG